MLAPDNLKKLMLGDDFDEDEDEDEDEGKGKDEDEDEDGEKEEENTLAPLPGASAASLPRKARTSQV